MPSLFDEGFELEEAPKLSMRIALRKGTNPKANAPVLSGYMVVRLDQAEALVEAAKSAPNGTAFLSVALWEDRDGRGGDYPLGGNVTTRHFNRDKELTVERKTENAPNSIWY